MKRVLFLLLATCSVFDVAHAQSQFSTPADSTGASKQSTAAEAFPKPGEWPSIRRSGTLEAHSPLKGNITNPKIAWKQFVGTLETHIVVEPSDTQVRVSLPNDEPRDGNSSDAVSIDAFVPKLPVEDQNICANEASFTYADILPEYPGKEKIEFESAFHKAMVNGQWPQCVGRCLAQKDGKWVTIWETKPISDLFISLPLVGDFDNDGNQEIAILPFYALTLIDARTGVIKDSCKFTDNRSYGFAGAYDFDHDGRSEFLIEADFSKHLDVLGFGDDKKLSLLWTQNVEEETFRPRKVMRVAPDPTADVDGDGQAEVIATLFDVKEDGKWHLSFLNALTGKEKYDFPDEMFADALDLDGDKVPEILSTVTSGVNALPSIRVRSIKDGSPRVLWECEGKAWETYEPNLPANVKSSAILGQRKVLSQARAASCRVVLREEISPSQASVSIMQWDGAAFKPVTTISGDCLNGVGFDTNGRLLVRSKHAVGRASSLAVVGGKPVQQSTCRVGFEPGPAVVAWADNATAPTIVVQGPIDEQVTFSPPTTGEEGAQCKYLPGRSQGGWYPKTLGPVVADLAGDGNRQLIVADRGTDGCARLTVTNLDGDLVWRHEFPRIPGTHVHYNTGGITQWQAGHFRDKKQQDILVTVQRSMLGTEETCLLSGTDGTQIWNRDKQISKRGVGGNSFAVADYDGDGLDDVASLWPSILYILKGTNGEDILAMDACWKQVYEKQVYFGQAVAGDFLNDGKPSFFFSGRLMTGVIKTEGTLVWFDALDKSAPHLPSLGDFDGDGKMDMIGVGFDDGIRCYDLADGKIKWRITSPVDVEGFGMHSANLVNGAVAADIDGDGRDEALISMKNMLYCLGSSRDGSAGEIRWHVDFPTQIGPPTIAQLEPNGNASILEVGSDGHVYCLR